MDDFWKKSEDKLGKFFTIVSKIALAILGLLLVVYIFRELFYLGQYLLIPESNKQYYAIFEGILSFFLFLEFLILVMTSLKHGGHVSLTFLITLAITAIVRSLLIAHDDDWLILVISGSVLILSIALAIIHHYKLDDDHQ